MASLSNSIINYMSTYVIDKLWIVKGWRHQLAILGENGSSMAYSVDPEQTAPIVVSILNLSVMLGNYLQQTT